MTRRDEGWLDGQEAAVKDLAVALCEQLFAIYGAQDPIAVLAGDPRALPARGRGLAALPALWAEIVAGSSHLAAPGMMGHMDSAPHPAAALTDALVSALNNNLLFRELSPLASRLEESLLADLAPRFGYPANTPGIFCSGGSLANLTALFAACGGYKDPGGRERCRLFVGSAAHGSIGKAAAILGLAAEQIRQVESDAQGRIDPAALDAALVASPDCRNIVAGVFGSTIHGALDDPAGIAKVCQRHDAWFHLDAVYGGALAFSRQQRARLTGAAEADSLAWGPQKWLYVPRLSALVFFKDAKVFDERLAVDLPYSLSGETHRGRWGLQGSRRADVLPLWVTLQVMGTSALGKLIDDAIARTGRFHEILEAHSKADPSHRPDLNLQSFRWGPPDRDGERLAALQRSLTAKGGPWVSLARWQGESLLRAVLLSPFTTEAQMEALLDNLEEAEASL